MNSDMFLVGEYSRKLLKESPKERPNSLQRKHRVDSVYIHRKYTALHTTLCHGHVVGCLSGMPSAQSYCYQATSAAEMVVQPWPEAYLIMKWKLRPYVFSVPKYCSDKRELGKT